MASPSNQNQPLSITRLLQYLHDISSDESIAELRGLEQRKAELEAQVKSLNLKIDLDSVNTGRLVEERDENAKETEKAESRINELVREKYRLQTEKDNINQQLESSSLAITKWQKEIKFKEAAVQKLQTDVNGLEAQVREAERDRRGSETELEQRNSELRIVKDELTIWKNLSVSMMDSSVGSIKSRLDRVLEETYKVAETYMKAELPPKLLGNTEFWEAFREANPGMPLPASNSAVAKYMRKVAFIARLGSSLAQGIFTPFYGPYPEMQAFWATLSDLARENPTQEACLRSMLLRMFPKDQDYWTNGLVKVVVRHVKNIFQCLVTPDKRAAFETDLKCLCDLALKEWHVIQKLKDKIVAEMDTKNYPDTHWILLEGPSKSPPAESNGALAPHRMPNVQPNSAIQSGACEVWPSFIKVNNKGETSIKKGYVLLQSEMRPAADEEDAQKANGRARTMRQGSKRARRPSEIDHPALSYLSGRSGSLDGLSDWTA